MNKLLSALIFASSMASASEIAKIDKELKLITLDDGSTYLFDDVTDLYVGQEVELIRPFDLQNPDEPEEGVYDEFGAEQNMEGE